jgi:hypothetical protein
VKIAWHRVRTIGGVWQYLSFSNVPVLTAAVCGRALSWRRQTLLTDRLRRFE